MNRVAPSRRASAPQRLAGARRERAARAAPPRSSGRAGRGRSVGRSSTRARRRAARASRRAARSSASPASQRRCQTAKSAYWTGSSGSGEGRPAANAA